MTMRRQNLPQPLADERCSADAEPVGQRVRLLQKLSLDADRDDLGALALAGPTPFTFGPFSQAVSRLRYGSGSQAPDHLLELPRSVPESECSW
jgi:hypothetical protein